MLAPWLARARALWSGPRLTRFRAGRWAKRLERLLRWGVLGAVFLYLALELTRVGWIEVAQALPAQPLFYVLFVVRYLALPVSEMGIYGAHLRTSLWGHPAPFLIKRVYNFAIVGYAGEAYFGWWANRRLGLSVRSVLAAIKDVNLLSAAASNLITLALLAWLVLDGGMAAAGLGLDPAWRPWVIISVVGAAAATLIASLFHRTLLAVSGRQALVTLFVHALRLLATFGLQAWQWAVVFPDAPLSTWVQFLTAQAVLYRVPFLPNRDLLFLGLSLSLAGAVEAPAAQVYAMFVMSTALTQGANLLVLAAAAFADRPPRREGAS